MPKGTIIGQNSVTDPEDAIQTTTKANTSGRRA